MARYISPKVNQRLARIRDLLDAYPDDNLFAAWAIQERWMWKLAREAEPLDGIRLSDLEMDAADVIKEAERLLR